MMVVATWLASLSPDNSYKSQGHKVVDLRVISKDFISLVCMPNMKSLSLIVQKLGPRLKFFCNRITDRQSDCIKTRCTQIPFGGGA